MSQKITAVTMPKWGIEMTEGAITAWNLALGQQANKGDALLDVETEKIVNQVESPGAGVLRRILADAGDTKPVGALIGVLADADVTEREIDNFVASFRGATVTFEPDSPADAAANAAPQPPVASSGGGDTEQRISPVARRIAERMGVDVSNVPGTGRNGRVSKEDVEAYIAARSAATAAPDFQRVRLSATRKTIARRLTEAAQSIPHIRLDIDVAADALLARRAALTSQGVGASVNDMLLRVCALALLEHPQINAQLDGDDLLQFKHADIAMAVATPAGLVTPIIRQADRKSIEAIAAESRTLVERASAGMLARDDISGGSFTISNLGMHGIQRFDAIINPPQVAILAVGRIEERAVVRQGVIGAARMLTLTLAADHRVVDGAVGARFLDTMRRLIESSSAL
jgi:pyruvate dehydrogenase E2 component (dihydrolipoamide acetyltransferase)